MPDPTAPLTAASKGLLYPSETDSPFTPFVWPAGPATAQAAIQQNAPPPAGAKIESVPPDAFFAELTDDPAFGQLQKTLAAELSNVQVLRVGEVRITIYLIGQTPDGQWAGLKTLSVET